VSSKDITKVKVSHWSMNTAPTESTSVSMLSVVFLAEFPHIPCRMPVQCSSVYHWFCDAAVMCRSASGHPVLPFGSSASNCRSEHIHVMIMFDVAVTTEQHEGKYIGLILA
jgi:hypothetical protein